MAFASSSSSVIRSAQQLVRPTSSARSLARGKIAVRQVVRPYSAAAAAAAYSESSSSQSFSPQPSSSSSSSTSSSFQSTSNSQGRRTKYNPSKYDKSINENKNENNITGEEAQIFLTNLLGLKKNEKEFSKELSLQIITHKSFRYSNSIRHSNSDNENDFNISNEPHNSRLSFIGRRAIQTYFSIFIHDFFNSVKNEPLSLNGIDFLKGLNLEDRLDNLRDTRNLGRLVAPNWKIEKIIRWDKNETSRESGNLKILGMTIESILGGIFNEFGSPAAQRTFHLMILPFYIKQLKDPRLIERVLNLKDQIENSGKGILRI
ncbi:mitochondrial 54S ribosomal protein mL57 [Kwoniella pini CBS 10737]|uniref:RNase III domain-containing protein n=1 Tax=Kwoniella pini CBS 10737 TaxID=1296096 RepID=A0A1B9HXJ7_9TREE|nr:uncharacterized protein I206_05858 [Kwoniella pini CBS 10737]OCF47992.1 hypothetical protein I206_05858 [Kwoniella pini CBS 10737]